MPWIAHTNPNEEETHMTPIQTKLPPPPTPPTPVSTAKRVTYKKVSRASGDRILLYGPGGIGKTTLASKAPGPVVFFDLDESLGKLSLENEPSVVECNSWRDLRLALQSEGWDDVKTIVIDSVTRAEEFCTAHTLATVKHEKGHNVTRLEDYGFGKGYQHVYETFLPLMQDLDVHVRAGRNVILIAHDCTHNVPNPTGEDWIRYEPRLQDPNSGKGSIRLRMREWADHVLFLGYDVAVKDGKGKGAGTRTLWPAELPHCMAKSRATQTPVPIVDDSDFWSQIIKA